MEEEFELEFEDEITNVRASLTAMEKLLVKGGISGADARELMLPFTEALKDLYEQIMAEGED